MHLLPTKHSFVAKCVLSVTNYLVAEGDTFPDHNNLVAKKPHLATKGFSGGNITFAD